MKINDNELAKLIEIIDLTISQSINAKSDKVLLSLKKKFGDTRKKRLSKSFASINCLNLKKTGTDNSIHFDNMMTYEEYKCQKDVEKLIPNLKLI